MKPNTRPARERRRKRLAGGFKPIEGRKFFLVKIRPVD